MQQQGSSRVERHNHSDLVFNNGMIQKIIEPGIVFDTVTAQFVASSMREYRYALESVGVPTPPQYGVEVVENAGVIRVIERANNMGPDCEREFRQNGLNPRALVLILGSMVEAIDDETVGIDPDLANWCVRDDTATFVDFHPARFRYRDRYLVGFPQPDDEADVEYSRGRYYSPLGVVRRLRFHLMRVSGGASVTVLDAAMERALPGGMSREFREQLAELPVNRIGCLGRAAAVDLVESLGVWNVDDIREIALRFGPQNGDGFFRKRIFDLTTVDFRIPLPIRQERLAEAKSQIISML